MFSKTRDPMYSPGAVSVIETCDDSVEPDAQSGTQESWLKVPVPVAEVAVHDLQLTEVTLVFSEAQPNPIPGGST